ncbi:hypothetical protein [Neolewinella antarctica]|uniref:Succinate dehydrogenase/fumarate reductase cytochrome b subunit n=1 Tax=Neolewinella antarctica TaxID=442734 RepID=A0ABX0XHQ6_9BACT|nr:hypothetical protein [Neolewinella antarctica]NJC28364.1 succinate dehydrogenase/fumarate reductase cytochrome b subunit [Neolewinella antarctica]
MDEEPKGAPAPITDDKAWLDRLQQESWQLELIISDFSIFLLLAGLDPFLSSTPSVFALTDQAQQYFIFGLITGFMSIAYLALLICLIVHVVFRGLWIAAIGLRYVSGDIDYVALRYQPTYQKWLRRRLGTFDEYILRLERYSSVIFSVAFLVLFCFISVTAFFAWIYLLQQLDGWLTGVEMSENGVFAGGGIFGITGWVLGLLYLIDFFTLGFFKRNRFTAKVYYPIYRLMGWVTLANLYRPLYHNLVDDRFGRKLARLLPLIVIGVMCLVSLRIITHPYFPGYFRDGEVWVDYRNYADEGADIRGQRFRVTLASRYVQHDYVEAFASYRPRNQDPAIERKFPDLDYARYTGLKLGEPIQLTPIYNFDPAYSYDTLLLALSSVYRLYVNDSLRQDVPARFFHSEWRDQPGLLYMIPTHDLPVGEHILRVDLQRLRNDSLVWERGDGVRFYK